MKTKSNDIHFDFLNWQEDPQIGHFNLFIIANFISELNTALRTIPIPSKEEFLGNLNLIFNDKEMIDFFDGLGFDKMYKIITTKREE